MINEIVTQTHALPAGVEVSFGILTAPHALAEIIVNPDAQPAAAGSEWRLYDVATAGGALIWRGTLTGPFEGAQRLTPEGGIAAGALYELRAFSHVAVGALTASLVGYDPQCCAPDDDGSALLVWGKLRLDDLPTPCFVPPGYDNSSATTVDPITLRAPRDGALSHLWIEQKSPGVGPGIITYTVRVNGIATALAVAIAIGTASDSNVADRVSVLEGDEIDVWATVAGLADTTFPERITATARFGKP